MIMNILLKSRKFVFLVFVLLVPAALNFMNWTQLHTTENHRTFAVNINESRLPTAHLIYRLRGDISPASNTYKVNSYLDK